MSGAKNQQRAEPRQSPRNLTPGQRRTAHRTAIVLALLCLFGATPALGYLQLATAPGWSRAMLVGSMLQLAFIAWMASIPDRGSMWVMMIVLSAAATIYGIVASIALVTSTEFDLPLDLNAVRWTAFWWSGLMMALSTAAAYYSGHTAQKWLTTSTSPPG